MSESTGIRDLKVAGCSFSHPFPSPCISFIPSGGLPLPLLTVPRAGGSCPWQSLQLHLHLSTKGKPTPAQASVVMGQGHILPGDSWTLSPRGRRGFLAVTPQGSTILLYPLPTCASKPWPCLKITWKHFQNICLGLPQQRCQLSRFREGHRNLYVVKVPLDLPTACSRMIHLLLYSGYFTPSRALDIWFSLFSHLGAPLAFFNPSK